MIKSVAELDVFVSMAIASSPAHCDYVRPEFVTPSTEDGDGDASTTITRPVLDLRDCRNPVQELINMNNGAGFVPNDTVISD